MRKRLNFEPIFLDIETTGLKPLEDRIVAVGLKVNYELFYVDEGEWDTKIRVLKDEVEEFAFFSEMIEDINKFIDTCRSEGKHPLLVGYNVGFDLGFISARSAILHTKFYDYTKPASVKALEIAGLLRGLPRVDLMHVISRYWLNNGRYVKMKDVCSALGVEFDDCDGSEIPELVEKGEWDKIEDHLRADLERLKKLYDVLRLQGLIQRNIQTRYNLHDCEVLL